MIIQDSMMRGSERLSLKLRQLYYDHGFQPYHMSKFEEYDFYARNKDFLVSDNVITFTDTNGKLMALKPDVTLSIIKNLREEPGGLRKVCYAENVYRVAKGANGYQEIMQVGVECFGAVTKAEMLEVLLLAAESLRCLHPESVLEISDLSLLEGFAAELGLTAREAEAFYTAVGEKNLPALEAMCPDEAVLSRLTTLLSFHGTAAEARELLRTQMPDSAECRRFQATLEALAGSEAADQIRVDFSLVDDLHYYNGIVFKGFISGIPAAVLSGGQYDRLMRSMKRSSGAVGFAVYTDQLERMDEQTEAADGYLNVALPKGRLGEKVYAMFARAGYECPSVLEPGRKLIFENAEKKVRYFWVKPSDVAIYVERGAADVGVAGKDILLEYEPDIYELLDLKMGKCRMAVAAPKGFRDDPSRTLRVATKFQQIAGNYYRAQGRDIDMIHLNGSIELAPILGLSDVIVDIVETGTTLRENNLEVVETVVPISARLIANKSSYKFKQAQIERIAKHMAQIVEETK